MKRSQLSPALIQRLDAIHNKRARLVIDHILQHGSITTEDLKQYGYDHPPRAARDVREAGIPLETFYVRASNGRRIAAYRFGDLSQLETGKLSGRTLLSKNLKRQLYQIQDARCAICGGHFELHELQTDHRIPFLVAGNAAGLDSDPSAYMLLCAPHNRSKSWACEHCANGIRDKRAAVCASCYWASPENYIHVALRPERRVDLIWQGGQVRSYDRLQRAAHKKGKTLQEFLKDLLGGFLRGKS